MTPPRVPRPRLAILALFAAVLVLPGCGVPTNERPRALSADNVPFDLLAPVASSTTTTTAPPVAEKPPIAQIYLLSPSYALVAVDRPLSEPVQLDNVIATLLEGPSVGEGAAGFSTVINTETRLLGAQVVDGTAMINLSSEFATVGVQEQVLAFAQFVYTATGVPGVRGVTFAVEGATVEVPTQAGTSTRAPVTRQDYERLALP